MREELPTSETEMIARARAGDAEAFCALAARYERRVHSLALHFCRDAADAEDLSQEVWLRAYRSLDSFRAESSLYTWLRRIAVNLFLNDRRAARSRGEALSRDRPSTHDAPRGASRDDEATESSAARAFDVESALHERLLLARVRDALAELSPQQRLVFLLKHEEGLTYEEIAREINCSTGTVKKSLARAVAKLRARLLAETASADGVSNKATHHDNDDARDATNRHASDATNQRDDAATNRRAAEATSLAPFTARESC
jgi:RNA polymerase sigma-70 factor (ECF subfamily)